jgi:ABC-type multidrug transport system ATPase subunit
MIEIITDYVIPTGAIYAFGLFSLHIADSARFVATRLGITNPGQEIVNEHADEAQPDQSEQGEDAEEEEDEEMMETMEGGFAAMSRILEEMGERHELSDSRMLSLHKYNKTMFSRLSSRLDSTERLFEEIHGPLEEIIQGIQESSTRVTGSIEVAAHHPVMDNSQIEDQMEAIKYD